MQYKLLSIHGKKETNIGDYIQALASAQFLPSVDGFVDREQLKDYSGQECRMIMNGWFMHNPEQWPPSPLIHPLFVAFHINTLAEDVMLGEESLRYLKRHEPIGCRDIRTADILKNKGVEAYFSGCMTLTLGHTYAHDGNNGKVYFVDPYLLHTGIWFLYYGMHCIYLLICMPSTQLPENIQARRKDCVK